MAVTGHLGGGFTFSAQGDVYSGDRAFVKYMRWVGSASTAANDQLVVVDKYGDIVFRSIADGAYFIDMMPVYKWIEEIHVNTMGSGVLDVIMV